MFLKAHLTFGWLGFFKQSSAVIRHTSIYFSSLAWYISKCLDPLLTQWLTNKTAPNIKEWRFIFFFGLLPCTLLSKYVISAPTLSSSYLLQTARRSSCWWSRRSVPVMCADRKTWVETLHTCKPWRHQTGAFLTALQTHLESLNTVRDQRQKSIQT